jgi:hypothetical protein
MSFLQLLSLLLFSIVVVAATTVFAAGVAAKKMKWREQRRKTSFLESNVLQDKGDRKGCQGQKRKFRLHL